ncbi:tyrosyl-DNA phosphodiesterase 2 isoform X2 [Aplysia californica]|nr:tyrosyl-DNA phosphodiesterase 2 isoform X2 [Aplysia californica]
MASEASAISLSDSDEEEEDANLPSREECEQRCQSFCEVTGADSALAMYYLQNRKWNLEAAVSDFFPEADGGQLPKPMSSTTSEASKNSVSRPKSKSDSADQAKAGSSSSTEKCLTLAPPVLQPKHENTIKVLSWNIDGLDPDNLQSRTEGACSVLTQENAEVIFLQEVVERSLSIIRNRCSNYQVFVGVEGDVIMPNAYFTAVLLRKDCTNVHYVNIADFPGSLMTRNLLEVKADVKNVPMVLLTSHLESTAEYSAERKKQLKMAFGRVVSLPQDCTVVFGGDLNLREKELAGDSAKPLGVYDLWECTGKRPEAKHTWDLMRNDNKQLGGKFQPRCRFDRLYARHSKPVSLKPVYFELVGIQRLASCRRYPSDHWGILAHFNIQGTAKA